MVKYLSNSHSLSLISFGDYVRQVATERHLQQTREVLQLLGSDLLASRGAAMFLQDVISFSKPTSTIHIIDGIRHGSVIDALRNIYSTSFVIFLNLNDNQRYLRYVSRANPSDPILSFPEFNALSSHSIERDIPGIAEIANEA